MKTVRASIIGVYGTAHTTRGDIDTGPPEAVNIDCEMIVFDCPIDRAPFDATVDSFTLHFGTTTVRVPVTPPVAFRRGERVVVIQPVSMDQLLPRSRA